MSNSLAVSHYHAVRRDSGVGGRSVVPHAPLAELDQVSTSVDWATKGLWSRTPDVESALTLVTGVTEKMVMDSGRDTVINAVRDDKYAKGWARVPEPGCCAFCALLSTRGAVYKKNTAGFESHDHCRCHAEPVFTQYEPTAKIREWESLYSESTKNASGSQKMSAFRKAYDAKYIATPGAPATPGGNQ